VLLLVVETVLIVLLLVLVLIVLLLALVKVDDLVDDVLESGISVDESDVNVPWWKPNWTWKELK
jgi:hypothetical protein